jgi:iron complex outermembrane receptor protein
VFSASLSYTWSDFTFDEFIEDDADYSGKSLPGLPENFAYLGLTYSASAGLTGTLEVLYAGDLYANNDNSTRVSQYTVSNFRVSYELHRHNWTVRPFLSINNLFDELYNSNVRINAFGGRYYEPAPERNLYAGIVVNFGKSSVSE